MIFTDRNRVELRKFREEEAACEQAEREERERPIREAEAKLAQTANELANLERQRIASGKDDESWADPIWAGKRMTKAEARQHNIDELVKFAKDNPDLCQRFWTPTNTDAVIAYLERNDIHIATVETYRRAFLRLGEYGLLEERPAPEPEPEPAPITETEPESLAEAEGLDGIDPLTNAPRRYSDYEVAQMSSDEYRRAANIKIIHPSGPRRWW